MPRLCSKTLLSAFVSLPLLWMCVASAIAGPLHHKKGKAYWHNTDSFELAQSKKARVSFNVPTRIEVSQTAIAVNGKKVLDLSAGKVPAAYKAKKRPSAYRVEPLYKRLRSVLLKRKIQARKGKRPFLGRYAIVADASTSYRLVGEVMYTAGQAGFSKAFLAACTAYGATCPVKLYRICTPKIAIVGKAHKYDPKDPCRGALGESSAVLIRRRRRARGIAALLAKKPGLLKGLSGASGNKEKKAPQPRRVAPPAGTKPKARTSPVKTAPAPGNSVSPPFHLMAILSKKGLSLRSPSVQVAKICKGLRGKPSADPTRYTFAARAGRLPFRKMYRCLAWIKRRHREQRRILFLTSSSTPLQTLIKAMDHATYKRFGSKELFPAVMLGISASN